ncbi:hypothetical protein D3C75_628180 [compost metagenome]
MHIITVNAADLERANPHVFADPVILVNDIIADFELGVALNPLGIVDSFGYLTRFALLLGEHFPFGDYRQMDRRQLKAGPQVTLQQRRFLNTVVIEHPAYPFHPFLTARKHHYLHT